MDKKIILYWVEREAEGEDDDMVDIPHFLLFDSKEGLVYSLECEEVISSSSKIVLGYLDELEELATLFKEHVHYHD